MLCLMHQSEPYGHLTLNGKPITTTMLARILGSCEKDVDGWLAELELTGVLSKTEDGVIFSRRMVKDESLRETRSDCGKMGGNPNLLKQKDNQNDNQKSQSDEILVGQEDKGVVNQSLTPSSSSSSSSSKALANKSARRHQLPDDFYPDSVGMQKANKSGIDPLVELESFKDYHRGKGTTMLDWQAAFRTWIGNAIKFGAKKNTPTKDIFAGVT